MRSDVYIEDLLAPNYDALLEDVLAHKHSQYMLKGGRGSLKSSFTGFVIPLIMLEHKANSRVYVQRFFLRQGVELQPEIELASYELMGELARINLGVSCMVRQFCRQELQSGKLFELSLTEPVPPRSIGMVSLKGVSLPPSVSRFVELMNETTRNKGEEKEE